MPKINYLIANSEEKSIETQQGDTLYNAFEKQGIELPHGCLAGACTACKILVTENPEGLEDPGQTEQKTLERAKETLQARGVDLSRGELRLGCQAKIKGDFTFTTDF